MSSRLAQLLAAQQKTSTSSTTLSAAGAPKRKMGFMTIEQAQKNKEGRRGKNRNVVPTPLSSSSAVATSKPTSATSTIASTSASKLTTSYKVWRCVLDDECRSIDVNIDQLKRIQHDLKTNPNPMYFLNESDCQTACRHASIDAAKSDVFSTLEDMLVALQYNTLMESPRMHTSKAQAYTWIPQDTIDRLYWTLKGTKANAGNFATATGTTSATLSSSNLNQSFNRPFIDLVNLLPDYFDRPSVMELVTYRTLTNGEDDIRLAQELQTQSAELMKTALPPAKMDATLLDFITTLLLSYYGESIVLPVYHRIIVADVLPILHDIYRQSARAKSSVNMRANANIEYLKRFIDTLERESRDYQSRAWTRKFSLEKILDLIRDTQYNGSISRLQVFVLDYLNQTFPIVTINKVTAATNNNALLDFHRLEEDQNNYAAFSPDDLQRILAAHQLRYFECLQWCYIIYDPTFQFQHYLQLATPNMEKASATVASASTTSASAGKKRKRDDDDDHDTKENDNTLSRISTPRIFEYAGNLFPREPVVQSNLFYVPFLETMFQTLTRDSHGQNFDLAWVLIDNVLAYQNFDTKLNRLLLDVLSNQKLLDFMNDIDEIQTYIRKRCLARGIYKTTTLIRDTPASAAVLNKILKH